MYLKRTIEPLETEDVGDNVANDSTAGDSKDTQIQETNNEAQKDVSRGEVEKEEKG